MNDFEEFALQFRKRTAARLLEFEKALDKAQTDVEKSVSKTSQTSQPSPKPQERTTARQPRAGQVKSVLRRQ